MADPDPTNDAQHIPDSPAQKIAQLESFKVDIVRWATGDYSPDLRTKLGLALPVVRSIVRETGTLKRVTLPPPPTGGLFIRDADPFHYLFADYYGVALVRPVCDMLDHAVAVLREPEHSARIAEALPSSRVARGALHRALLLCRRFANVAHALKHRQDGRPGVALTDEQDAHHLFQAIAHIDFVQVRKEVWTPSYSGGMARVDLPLQPDATAIAVRRTRRAIGAQQLAEQLLVDIQHYKSQPSCRSLIWLVYDPDHRIDDPMALEAKLTGQHDLLDVHLVVSPRDA